MKNKDDILKYLSDLMNEDEKASFEKELASSDELRSELARYKDFLCGLNISNEIQDDSHYFQNLLPRVRIKLDKQKNKRWIPRFAYLIPTATAVFLILMNTGKFIDNNKPGQADKKLLVQTPVEKNEVSELLSEKLLVEQVGTVDIRKSREISFEVGISGVANSETLKTIADKNFNISFMDEYILASK